MAEWLNTAFSGLDGGVFSAMHAVAVSGGGFFTVLAKIISLFGEKGIVYFAAGLVLMLFPKTRKLGVAVFGAVLVGAIFTNLIIKGLVARPRPFESSEVVRGYWEYIGSPKESDFSFPSGHMTAIMAAATALFIRCNKKWSWAFFFGVVLMGFARMYLIHHYFTDVIAGTIVGAIAAVIAHYVDKLIFYVLEKNKGNKFCNFCINSDIRNVFMGLFSKKKKKGSDKIEIVVTENAVSKAGEGYNRLRDNILFMNADGNTKVIQVESSLAHEGKTTVCCNIAVSLGYTNKKVCIVDLDFRRPRTHRAFGLSKDVGIAEYLMGNAELDKIVKHTEYPNVDIVTRGAKVYNPSLLLISDKFKEFMASLREKYDYVIVDCAPVLQVSDYIHISKVTDGVLFVVAYGITTKAQVVDAVNELKKNDIRVLGSVFTMYDSKQDEGYGRYGKYYYYNSYSKIYTVDDTDEDKKETAEEKN